jgi:hypothetical protein
MNAQTTLAAILATIDATTLACSPCVDITQTQYADVLAAAKGDNLQIVEGGVDIALNGEWFHIHTYTLGRSRQRGGDVTRYILTPM